MINISLSSLTGGMLPDCICRHLLRAYVRCSPGGCEPHHHSVLDVGRGQVVGDIQLEEDAMGPHGVEYLATEMRDSLSTMWAKEEVNWSCPSCNASQVTADESLYGKITVGQWPSLSLRRL